MTAQSRARISFVSVSGPTTHRRSARPPCAVTTFALSSHNSDPLYVLSLLLNSSSCRITFGERRISPEARDIGRNDRVPSSVATPARPNWLSQSNATAVALRVWGGRRCRVLSRASCGGRACEEPWCSEVPPEVPGSIR